MQSNLNRSFRYRKQAGNRRLRQIFAVAQHEELPVTGVQAAQSGLEIGSFDHVHRPVVVDRVESLHGGDRLRPNAGVVAKGLVADDRGQPLPAAADIAESSATPPGTQQCVLGYVLRLAWIARVAVGHSQAYLVRFAPLPSVA